MDVSTTTANDPRGSQEKPGQEAFGVIGFRVGSEEYGLRLVEIQEIISLPRLTRVPKAAPYILGVVNLHGNVVPVFDIAKKLGIGATPKSDTAKVVVVETADETIGLLAEAVSKVTRVAASEVLPPPPLVSGIGAQFIEGVVRQGNRFLIFLNLAETLAE